MQKRPLPMRMETIPSPPSFKQHRQTMEQRNKRPIATGTQKESANYFEEENRYQIHERLVGSDNKGDGEPEDVKVADTEKEDAEVEEEEEDQDGFRFKRHKNARTRGVISLGEKFDTMQDINNAKHMENFNSSLPPPIDQTKSSSQPQISQPSSYPRSQQQSQYPSSSMPPQSQLQPQMLQVEMPPQQASIPSIQGMHGERWVLQVGPENDQSYYNTYHNNNTTLGNASMQPFITYSQPPQQPYQKERLVPTGTDFAVKKSMVVHRWLRYCAKESWKKMQKDFELQNGELRPSKQIASTIIQSFLQTLKTNRDPVNWIQETESDQEEEDEEQDENEIFQGFGEDDLSVPNVKNLENRRNLQDLRDRIKNLQKEIKDWEAVMAKQNSDMEWNDFKTRPKAAVLDSNKTAVDEDDETYETNLDELKENLLTQMNVLRSHTHLLHSDGHLLNKLSDQKLNKLTTKFDRSFRSNTRNIDSKKLLKELSNSLSIQKK